MRLHSLMKKQMLLLSHKSVWRLCLHIWEFSSQSFNHPGVQRESFQVLNVYVSNRTWSHNSLQLPLNEHLTWRFVHIPLSYREKKKCVSHAVTILSHVWCSCLAALFCQLLCGLGFPFPPGCSCLSTLHSWILHAVHLTCSIFQSKQMNTDFCQPWVTHLL